VDTWVQAVNLLEAQGDMCDEAEALLEGYVRCAGQQGTSRKIWDAVTNIAGAVFNAFFLGFVLESLRGTSL
jgi:hypothetical protein